LKLININKIIIIKNLDIYKMDTTDQGFKVKTPKLPKEKTQKLPEYNPSNLDIPKKLDIYKMDTIEQGLKRIDEHNLSAINKHKELLSKAISESANISNKCSQNLDNEFIKVFPEINELNSKDTNIFNPITVIEFRDNKAYQIIDTWNKDNGLLPERKVMGEYFVDIGIYVKNIYCTLHKKHLGKFIIPHGINSQFTCSYDKITSWYYDCGCKLYEISNAIGNYPSTPDLNRTPDIKPFYADTTYTFQIDNYLNLYHNESGLYLMFNKTSFPIIPFHFRNNKYKKSIIYDSKRLEQLTNPKLFDKSYHSSIDSRTTFLNDINTIIPDDIIATYDFFNRFRQFKSFNFENTNIDMNDINTNANSNLQDLDPRDRLIESYKIRLESTTKRAENAERIMQTMVEEYEQKSVEIKTLNFEIQQMKLDLLNKQSEYKKELLENETKKIISYVNSIEDLKNSNYRLKQQLLEIEKQKLNNDMLGLSLDSIKKENAITLLSLEKTRAINDKLLNQIKTEKIKNDVITQENAEYKNNYMTLEIHNNQLQTNILKLEEQFNDKMLECNQFIDTFSKLGNTSSDALENALSDKVDLLSKNNTNLKEENNKLTLEHNKMYKQLVKLQTTLKNMIE